MANEKMVPMNGNKLSLSDILAMAGNKEQSKWGKISATAGTIESVLAAGKQLKTEDILGEILTVERVEYRDSVDKATGATTTFPIMTFMEKPGCFYNAGTLLGKNVMEWATACGDNPETDKLLTNLNEDITANGGPQIILYKKEGKNYTSVYVI